MRSMLYVLSLAFLVACQTTPKPVQTVPVPEKPIFHGGGIDYRGLQRHLEMEIPKDILGFQEKVFNTCEVGYGYSNVNNCRREYMVVINIHLQCRDSVGQVSEGVNNVDLVPISNKLVKWNLQGAQGTTETNGDGFAQIMAVSRTSQRRQRLKIGVGNEFLYMRANEITRVVTPRPWCMQ